MTVRAAIKAFETACEEIIFASRWLLAPIYLGLALALVVLLVIFVKELAHLALHAASATETDVILAILGLVDLSLTGSLVVIVIFSGYENFVSKIDHAGHVDWPAWMGTIDFTALKIKLMSSIVAISAIQLLKEFMSLTEVTPLVERKLYWMVTMHVVFVMSSLLLALSDWLSSKSHD